MIPVFCMLAPYPFFAMGKAWHRKKLLFALLPLVIWAIVLYLNLPVNSFLRATDFVSYGKGIKFQTGKSITALPYFHKAYQIAPYKQMTIVNFSDALLQNNRAKDALMVTSIASLNNPANPVYQYYLAVATLFSGNTKESEKLFAKIKPDMIASLKVQYYYYFGEAMRKQGRFKDAKKLYQKALEAEPTKNQKVLLDKSLKDCNGK
jgi:predicted Zn-dependent protease